MEGKPEEPNKPGEPDKTVTIVVNGVDKPVPVRSELSFDDLVRLAFNEKRDNPLIVYSISYTKGASDQHDVSLGPNDTVRVVDGMIFDVDRTDRS